MHIFRSRSPFGRGTFFISTLASPRGGAHAGCFRRNTGFSGKEFQMDFMVVILLAFDLVLVAGVAYLMFTRKSPDRGAGGKAEELCKEAKALSLELKRKIAQVEEIAGELSKKSSTFECFEKGLVAKHARLAELIESAGERAEGGPSKRTHDSDRSALLEKAAELAKTGAGTDELKGLGLSDGEAELVGSLTRLRN